MAVVRPTVLLAGLESWLLHAIAAAGSVAAHPVMRPFRRVCEVLPVSVNQAAAFSGAVRAQLWANVPMASSFCGPLRCCSIQTKAALGIGGGPGFDAEPDTFRLDLACREMGLGVGQGRLRIRGGPAGKGSPEEIEAVGISGNVLGHVHGGGRILPRGVPAERLEGMGFFPIVGLGKHLGQGGAPAGPLAERRFAGRRGLGFSRETAERGVTFRDGWKYAVAQTPTATPAVTSRQLLRGLPLRGNIIRVPYSILAEGNRFSVTDRLLSRFCAQGVHQNTIETISPFMRPPRFCLLLLVARTFVPVPFGSVDLRGAAGIQCARSPAALRVGAGGGGDFYGTTVAGGESGRGTVFRMSPAGLQIRVVSFTGNSGAAPGAAPVAGLALGLDGALYGTTTEGGTGGFGTIFRLGAGDVFTTLVNFTGGTGTARGSVPLPVEKSSRWKSLWNDPRGRNRRVRDGFQAEPRRGADYPGGFHGNERSRGGGGSPWAAGSAGHHAFWRDQQRWRGEFRHHFQNHDFRSFYPDG